MSHEEKIQWCINKHRETNHFYDTYLPYEFHLRMVVQVYKEFAYLHENRWTDLELACWAHDLIEDTRVSYNDCKEVLGVWVADVVYAVTNEKGKNRAERANEKYYNGIKENNAATFVKVCDRIANIQYSKMTGSKMFEMYKREHYAFVGHLYKEYLAPMFDSMAYLFNLTPMPSTSTQPPE